MWREGKSMCIKKQMAKPPQRPEPISSTTPSVLNTTDSSPFIWEWSKKDIKSAPPQKKEMIKKDIKQAPEQKRNDRHQLRKVKIGLPFSFFWGEQCPPNIFAFQSGKLAYGNFSHWWFTALSIRIGGLLFSSKRPQKTLKMSVEECLMILIIGNY